MTQSQKPDKVKKNKTKKAKLAYGLISCAIILLVLLYTLRGENVTITQYNEINRPAKIRPDYSGAVIPPNIAPLNFVVQQDGSGYFVRICSETGKPIEIFSKTPKIAIPQKAWHNLLEQNRGRQLSIDIYAKFKSSTTDTKAENEQWNSFKTITNEIAKEDIDAFIAYRRIRPGHRLWRNIGIYQRNLASFDESLILDNGYYKHGCLNCHTFCLNKPDKMLIGIRSSVYGSSTLLIENGEAKKIGTKFGYSTWHPSGRIASFSVNDVRLMLHSAANEVRDVMDFDSLMANYFIDSKAVKTSSVLTESDRLETYPTWSPDGRYLYFCSAPITWTDRALVPEEYDQIKYDLVRADYDIDHDQWGTLETLLKAEDTGLSIMLPRVSPDGRWLLFCMCNYGCFPVYQASSDLYMADLEDAEQTGQFKYRRLDINSDQSESWHSFSSNSRWIAFSSKRDYGIFTRIYLAYLNEDGTASKAILVPQKDPTHYDSCLWTYSVPELITEPVRITKEQLGKVVRASQKIPIEMPITMATPKPGIHLLHDEPWQTERE
jgi:Tol biopolymer transport system component